MKKFILSMAGAASLLTSASILIDYGTRKAFGKSAHPTELTAGIVGAVAGVTLAILGECDLPSLKKKKNSDKEFLLLLNDEDLAKLENATSEELDESGEDTSGESKPQPIELDEEATIEDFIEK